MLYCTRRTKQCSQSQMRDSNSEVIQKSAAVEHQNDFTSINGRAYVVYMSWAMEKDKQMREQAAMLLTTVLPKVWERYKRYKRKKESKRNLAMILRALDELGRRRAKRREAWERAEKRQAEYQERKAEYWERVQERRAQRRRDKAAKKLRIVWDYTGYDPLGWSGSRAIELWYSAECKGTSNEDEENDPDQGNESSVPVLDLFVGNF